MNILEGLSLWDRSIFGKMVVCLIVVFICIAEGTHVYRVWLEGKVHDRR
jgi:hypothetical protein